jgi:dienelactone hydrolase
VKRALRLLGFGLLGVVLGGALAAYGLYAGWFVKDVAPSEISALLRPYDEVWRPDGAGPFPTAILFHGCAGLRDHNRAWGRFLAEHGVLAVAADSFAGRGLAWRTVCAGRALLGPERAGDVAVTLDDVRRMPDVDPERIVLFGWSHGAWAVMDLLAMDPPSSRPTNLASLPDDPLHGVVGSVLFFPWCSFGARAPGHWAARFPVLLLLAERDTVVSTPDCLETAATLRARGVPIETEVLPGVDHGFDAFDTRGDFPSHYDEAATTHARERVLAFLKADLR